MSKGFVVLTNAGSAMIWAFMAWFNSATQTEVAIAYGIGFLLSDSIITRMKVAA